MPALEDLLSDLNAAQRAAVEQLEGPLLVLAGPGSGKTRVITRRVAYLIANGIPPWQILAMTFTNKAAGEMRSRIDALLGPEIPGRQGLAVSTFHAFCSRLLRRYAERAGLDPSFVIYDSADQREAIKQALALADVGALWAPGAIGAVISKAKNDLIDAQAFAKSARDFRDRQAAEVYKAYQKVLAQSNALDFDDLLMRTVALLHESAETRRELQERFRYLLVDEYQDTNRAQFLIARALAEGHGNICVVGDPDQSIYGWRGADIGNILDFESHFPNATVVALGQNYRSTGHIVAASEALIGGNRQRKQKRLYTELGDGEPVRVVVADEERSEAKVVVQHLHRWSEAGVPWREMAVLYRMNALSRVMEEALRNAQIPYRIVRGTAFYDRKEIRDALAYLRLIVNPADEISLNRALGAVPRGLGATSLRRLEQWAQERGLAFAEALRRANEVDGLTARARSAARSFAGLFDGWRASAAASVACGGRALGDLVARVINQSGLREHVLGAGRDEDDQRSANLDELVNAAVQFEPSADSVRPVETLPDLLAAWLESVALVSDVDALDPECGAVTLMTLHAAKGLEFDAVAIIGLEQGLLPHSRAMERENELEEERRLCFVGMTRARRHLLMTRARKRTVLGRWERTVESQFLYELPPDGVQRESLRDPHGDADGSGDGGSDDAGAVAWRAGEGPVYRFSVRRRRASEDGYEIDRSVGDDVDRPAWTRGLHVGALVRHPTFGYGRVDALMPRGPSSTVRVLFDNVGAKTLVIEYAKLEIVQ